MFQRIYYINGMNNKQRFISGFVDIAQGLAKILTLGRVKGLTSWAYRYAKYCLFK